MSWGVSGSGTMSEKAPTCVSGSHRPAMRQQSESSAQSTTCCRSSTSCRLQVGPARVRRPRRCPRPTRRRPARWACPPPGGRGAESAGSRWRSRHRFLPRARGETCRRCAGRHKVPPCRSGRTRPCGRGTPAGRSPCRSRSIGTTPADWAASTRKNAPASRTIAAIDSIGCTVPSTFEACVMATSDVLPVIAARIASGST